MERHVRGAESKELATVRFSGKLSEDDLDDLAFLLRPRFYWVRVVLTHWEGFGIALLLAWASILPFLRRTEPYWRVIAGIWVLLVGTFVWAAHSVRKERRQELSRLDATVPASISLTNNGISLELADRPPALIAWRDVIGWREHGRLIALDARHARPAVVLPLGHLSDIERESVRGRLRQFVPSVEGEKRPRETVDDARAR